MTEHFYLSINFEESIKFKALVYKEATVPPRSWYSRVSTFFFFFFWWFALWPSFYFCFLNFLVSFYLGHFASSYDQQEKKSQFSCEWQLPIPPRLIVTVRPLPVCQRLSLSFSVLPSFLLFLITHCSPSFSQRRMKWGTIILIFITSWFHHCQNFAD